MNDPTSQALVAPSDIADMAGVSRGAVSNWRKRAADFPAPVAGTPERPLFARADVLSWMHATGKDVKRADPGLQVWTALNTLRGELRVDEMADVVLSLACARKLSDESQTALPVWIQIQAEANTGGFSALDLGAEHDIEDWSDLVTITDAMRETPVSAASLIIDALSEVNPEELADVADHALTRIASAQIRAGVEHGFVGSRVSTLLANLAGPEAEDVIYDPACGTGSALLAAVKVRSAQNNDGYGPITRVIGHDINRDALRVARKRAYLHGVEIDLDVTDVVGGDFDPELKADVILLEPPFGQRFDGDIADRRWTYGTPPRTSADMAWIQHCLAHLTEGGRAYVVTTIGPLFRSGTEGAIRTELVRRGCVDAVFALPGRMLPHTSVPLAVWILCRPGDSANRGVLFVDGTGVEKAEDHVFSWLGARLDADESLPTAFVPFLDVVAADGNLNPIYWTAHEAADVDEIASTYTGGLRDLNRTLETVADVERPVRPYIGDVDARLVKVGDLVKQQVIETRLGRTKQEETDEWFSQRLVTPSDVRSGDLPQTPGLVDERDVLTLGTDLTRPGDVLVTTTDGVRAVVDVDGGHAVGAGVTRVRILDDQLDPVYLAAMLRGTWNDRVQAGAALTRARVQDLEVPLLPREAQRLFARAAEVVADLRRQAQALADQAETVETALLDVVRFGVRLDRSE